DVGAAAAYADRVVLLEKGRVRANGAPRDVLTSALLTEVYQYPVEVSVSGTELKVGPTRMSSLNQQPPQGGQQ
ncbi:MAG: hypothetical protein ACO4AZ_10990, partial [Ilumatobacteraceae bacterium]